MKEFVIALKNRLEYSQANPHENIQKIALQIRYLLSTPFIYGMAPVMLVFHLCLEIYHRVAFYLYDIKYVDMKDHFVFDRFAKKELNTLQKLNCIYCEYGNGLASYIQEIIGKTEAYWCPLKHKKHIKNPHSYYDSFMEYDTCDFSTKRDTIRDKAL